MSTELKNKNAIIKKFQKSTDDTGSPEVQIAIFTKRIQKLTEHLQSNKKDFACKRGLLMLVGSRRRMLNYLKNIDINRYRAILKELEIRK